MRAVTLTRRQARLLRDNLTGSPQGYDYLDLVRLDHLAKKLTALQGEYGERLAELGREEKQLRRRAARAKSPIETDDINRDLLALRYEVEDLNDAADLVEVELRLEDGDYTLVLDKVSSVDQWLASDELRPVIIGMMEAVKGGRLVEEDAALKAVKAATVVEEGAALKGGPDSVGARQASPGPADPNGNRPSHISDPMADVSRRKPLSLKAR